jgi:fatty acid synthase subunit alpha
LALNLLCRVRNARAAPLCACAHFGGQGTNEVYFDELQSLYDIYKPFLLSFISTVNDQVFKPLAEANQSPHFYGSGMDIIANPSLRFSTPYLASVPILFSLIGLTQLAQYLVVCRIRVRCTCTSPAPRGIPRVSRLPYRYPPPQLRIVHRQCHQSLQVALLRWPQGTRGFPATLLEPSIVQDATVGGEGQPTPMILVTGFPLKYIERHVNETNKYLSF